MSAQISGSELHWILFFGFFALSAVAGKIVAVVAIWGIASCRVFEDMCSMPAEAMGIHPRSAGKTQSAAGKVGTFAVGLSIFNTLDTN